MDKQLLRYFKGDELAASAWLSKYKNGDEVTPDDMHKRLAKEFAKIEYEHILKDNELEHSVTINDLSDYGKARFNRNNGKLLPRDLFKRAEDEIYTYFKDFKYIIPQGSVMSMLGTQTIGSLSNCFVIGENHDSYGSIMRIDEEQIQLMKRRGGVGHDLSHIRPNGTEVNNSAKTSTGIIPFMNRYSNSTREVAQGGRRGALMLSIDIRHPDSLDFIKSKRDITKITGANISVKIDSSFMQAVEKNEDFILRYPIDLEVTDKHYAGDYNELVEEEGVGFLRKVKAREYWDEIIKSAHSAAEPGIIFEDNHIQYSPDGVYEQYKGICTNPCFRGDMSLLTAEGYRTFEELENQEVELINKDGEIVDGTVWCSGVKDIFEVLTWNNKKIYCTEDHRFLTIDGEDLPIKDAIGKRIKLFFNVNKEVDNFTKLGFIQGDGQLTDLLNPDKKGIEINIGEDDEDIWELFGYKKEGRKIYTTDFTKDIYEQKFYLRTSENRILPQRFYNWNHAERASFIKGLFSANGCVIKKHRVSFKTTSLRLVEELMFYFETVGIECYYTTNKGKEVEFNNGNYVCKESYDLNITKIDSILKFADTIGFVHKYKNLQLENLIDCKSPKVRKVSFVETGKVYDFNLEDNTHWGVVEGMIAHNCGEIFMQPYDACRLIVTNLFSFVDNPFTKDALFNMDKFYRYNYEAMRMADHIIDLEIGHIDRILDKIDSDKEPESIKRVERELWIKVKKTALSSRRAGLGFTALGDALAALGLKYDSKVAMKVVESIMHTKLKSELDCTIDLAILRGPFEGWDRFKEYDEDGVHTNEFYGHLARNYKEQVIKMLKYGRRNVSWSTLAPTGTVSLMSQTTSGIEPMFMPFYMRRKKINPDNKDERIDFIDEVGDSWQEFPVLHEKFKDWITIAHPHFVEGDIPEMSKEDLQQCFEESPWYGSTANDIDWVQRVEMQAIIQRYTTHSISSTINLPSTVSEEEVSEIYLESWKRGLKGVTVKLYAALYSNM